MYMCRVIRMRANAVPPSPTNVPTIFNLHANDNTTIPPRGQIVLCTGIIVKPTPGYLGLVGNGHLVTPPGLKVHSYILNLVRKIILYKSVLGKQTLFLQEDCLEEIRLEVDNRTDEEVHIWSMDCIAQLILLPYE